MKQGIPRIRVFSASSATCQPWLRYLPVPRQFYKLAISPRARSRYLFLEIRREIGGPSYSRDSQRHFPVYETIIPRDAYSRFRPAQIDFAPEESDNRSLVTVAYGFR